jgi:hypothetical protein
MTLRARLRRNPRGLDRRPALPEKRFMRALESACLRRPDTEGSDGRSQPSRGSGLTYFSTGRSTVASAVTIATTAYLMGGLRLQKSSRLFLGVGASDCIAWAAR